MTLDRDWKGKGTTKSVQKRCADLGAGLSVVLVAAVSHAQEPPAQKPDTAPAQSEATANEQPAPQGLPVAEPTDGATQPQLPDTQNEAPSQPVPVAADATTGPAEPDAPSDAASEPVVTESSSPPTTAPPPPTDKKTGDSPGMSWFPEIHGFVSQGFLITTQNNYLADSEDGSFEFTEVGLNFTKQLGNHFRVGMQLFMRDLGPIGNYKPQFDWFYLDYRFFDWLGIRAGRTKIPFGLYNEINDIDAARVPVLLPQSVYPTESRDSLLAQTGFELYGRTPLTKAGALEYRAYGGTIFVDSSSADPSIEDFRVPYVVGGRLMWETPLDGLRAGGTYQAVKFDYNLVLTPEELQGLKDSGALPAEADSIIAFDLPIQLWVTSLEYSAHDLLLAAEYGRWRARIKNDASLAVPNSTVENERFYAMASYQVVPWFSPGAYYAVYFPDVEDRKGRESYQHDIALTLRFDPTEHWLIKLEGHFMSGTAYLNPDLNGGIERSELTRDWGLFLLKTTGYF